ncbi:MAG: hypothetical protein WB615_12935, partial [Candidatus Tumulicola sp.]
EMEAAAGAAEARTAQIVAELGQRETELAAAQAAIEMARAQTAAAESQHAALQTEAAGLVTRATERDAELGALRARLQRLQRALDFREAEAVEMRTLLALQEKALESGAEAARSEHEKRESEILDSLDTLRESELRVAILSTRASQLSAELALSVEECALEDKLTMSRVSAAQDL